MNKNIYTKPSIEIKILENEDVITTSGPLQPAPDDGNTDHDGGMI